MSKVFIPNKGVHDYSDAERFGEIVFCTDGILSKFAVSQMHRLLSESMKDSTKEDWILATSLTILVSVASSIFVNKHGRLRLLLYDGERYVDREIVFEQEDKE